MALDQLAHRLQGLLEGLYHIERELGRGGMATVYLARDLRHDRAVAIKLLQPELTTPTSAERFLREIAITAKLQHPHILTLIDSGAADGLVYYVMPNVDGESLRERLIWEKQIAVDQAIRIAREVASALGYAHAQGVIHRDIKPENILLSAGHAVVADFGIARAVGGGGQAITQVGLPLGTPAYMSPEQGAGREDIDHRSDLYALGVVLFEMLAGRPPFVAPTVAKVIQLHLTEAPPRVSDFRSAIPPALDEIVKRALAKEPGQRFQSAKEFEDALSLLGAVETIERATPNEKLRLSTPLEDLSVPRGRTPALFKRLLIVGGMLGAITLGGIFLFRALTARAAGHRAEPAPPPGGMMATVGVRPIEAIGSDSIAWVVARGIADEVGAKLANLKRLKVLSTTTMQAAVSKGWTSRMMADSLGLEFLLEGSVQHAGNELAVTVRLIDARTDASVWGESYRRPLDDVLMIRQDVARKVTDALTSQVKGLED
jgi:serine/threonine-protein kinase